MSRPASPTAGCHPVPVGSDCPRRRPDAPAAPVGLSGFLTSPRFPELSNVDRRVGNAEAGWSILLSFHNSRTVSTKSGLNDPVQQGTEGNFNACQVISGTVGDNFGSRTHIRTFPGSGDNRESNDRSIVCTALDKRRVLGWRKETKLQNKSSYCDRPNFRSPNQGGSPDTIEGTINAREARPRSFDRQGF